MTNPITLAAKPGETFGNDEMIRLSGDALRKLFVEVFKRDSVLREETFLQALNAVMVNDNSQWNWCQRCELFRMHSLTSDCTPAGARPSGLSCVFEGCPVGTTSEGQGRFCNPGCPAGEYFDPLTVSCKPSVIVL